VLYIAQPALTFVAYLRPYDEKILINSAYVLVFSILLHGIFAYLSLNMYKKSPDGVRRMLRFATIFSNVAFMGIPLISVVLEADYPGSTMYALIYNITYNIFLWSLGAKICTEGRDENKNGIDDHDDHKNSTSIIKAFIHPTTIASAIGLVFFILPIEGYVPDIAEEAFVMLKNLVAPLSMLVIGLRLPDISFKGILKDTGMIVFVIMRHFALPLLALGLVKAAGLFLDIDPAVEMVIVILAAAPA
jgi:predicted permease